MTHNVTTTGESLQVRFGQFGPEEYDLFLRCKRLPESRLAYDYSTDTYQIETSARYASLLGVNEVKRGAEGRLPMPEFLFEHQARIVDLALDAKTYAVWSDCGSGKTLIVIYSGWNDSFENFTSR
jgi:hypothetical protein